MQRYLVILMLALSSVTAAGSGKVYKWVDQEGRVHYGDQPGDTARPLDLVPPPGHAATQGERRTNEPPNPTDKNSESKAPEQPCIALTEQIQKYEAADQLYELDDKGGRRLLSAEEHAKVIQDAHADLDKHCSKK